MTGDGAGSWGGRNWKQEGSVELETVETVELPRWPQSSLASALPSSRGRKDGGEGAAYILMPLVTCI